uniref:DUF6533 domain-containing protein n=1 Tax=Moniliophthora roreri TaxID=221103 RepID=A0A0W0G590_MONRR
MAEDPWALRYYMEALHFVVHVEYATVAILFYDYFLTVGREIQFLWDRTPWNLGRTLFIITRYMPFVGTFLTLQADLLRFASLTSCTRWTQAAVYLNVADIVVAEIILTLRVIAIWARDRKVATSLAVIFTGLVLGAVVAVARVRVEKNPFGEALYATYGVCPPVFASSHALSVAHIALVAYEIVLLVLTLIKAIGHWREPGSSSFINVFFADVGLYQPPDDATTRTTFHTHQPNDASSQKRRRARRASGHLTYAYRSGATLCTGASNWYFVTRDERC